MTVVGEGIESEYQLSQLLALGCGFGQGFHLARPAEPDRIEPLLESPATAPAGWPSSNGHTPSRIAAAP